MYSLSQKLKIKDSHDESSLVLWADSQDCCGHQPAWAIHRSWLEWCTRYLGNSSNFHCDCSQELQIKNSSRVASVSRSALCPYCSQDYNSAHSMKGTHSWILHIYSSTCSSVHHLFLSIAHLQLYNPTRWLTKRGLSMRAWRQHSAASCSRPFLM